MPHCDVIIVGAGIAGASAGYFLAATHRVIVLEREEQPGYHATGRSAALYTATYGSETVRALTLAAGPFFRTPPAGFAEHELLTRRGLLFVAREDQRQTLERHHATVSGLVRDARLLSAAEAIALCPVLRPGHIVAAMLEPDARDIDVAALLHGYLRGLRQHGGRIVTGADVTGVARDAGAWRVDTAAGTFVAPLLVNAAGAWADELALLAGARPLGLVPKRRTAMLVDAPDGHDVAAWPMVVDADEQLYFKPDAGRLLVSPADETPSPPCDARPDEIDVATGIERLQRATTVPVRRVRHSWAGLRTFAADKDLVAGFDPAVDGFFWLAGQGGYGIQTSPSMGRLASALIAGRAIPGELTDLGLSAAALAPDRPALAAAPR